MNTTEVAEKENTIEENESSRTGPSNVVDSDKDEIVETDDHSEDIIRDENPNNNSEVTENLLNSN